MEQPQAATTTPPTPKAPTPEQLEKANAAMQIQQALYDNALAHNAFGHYVNSLLFMVAVIVANTKGDEGSKMLTYITTKAAEIKAAEAAQPKET
jgi:hypothetical protein